MHLLLGNLCKRHPRTVSALKSHGHDRATQRVAPRPEGGRRPVSGGGGGETQAHDAARRGPDTRDLAQRRGDLRARSRERGGGGRLPCPTGRPSASAEPLRSPQAAISTSVPRVRRCRWRGWRRARRAWRPFRNCSSGVQLVEQRLGLLQVERVEAFGEPAEDRSQKFAGLVPLALITPEPCEAHRRAQFEGLCLLLARNRKRTFEMRFRFRSIRLAPTAARFPPPCDEYRLRTTFPWLLSPPSSLRQCSAKRHRIGRVPHGPSPNVIEIPASIMLLRLPARQQFPEVIIWTASEVLPVRAKSQPCTNIPSGFQNKAPFSSANAMTSLDCAFAAA